MDIRPRSTGEILDDAWRLALADAPLLALFVTLFLIPAFTTLLLLLAGPAPSGLMQLALPALAAFLLPLTGLASGACQELFRRRAADQPVSAGLCLAEALRHGLEHAAIRAGVLCAVLLGLVLLLMPGLALWVSSASAHALIAAGKGRSGTLLRELRRDAAFAPGKSAAIVLCRLPLLLLVVLELHLLGLVCLWVADNLAGFDTALLSAELAFGSNPVYTLALFLLAWLLLTPFFEAGNFLLHTDVRTRQEGLDLQYRVERTFTALARPVERTDRHDAGPTVPGRRVGAVLMLAGLLLVGRPVKADEVSLDTVRSVRQAVEVIRDEVKKAEPYPGGKRWVGRLRELGAKLTRPEGGEGRRFRWFDGAIRDFPERTQADAVRVLDDLHRRLSLLEDSLAAPPGEDAEGTHGEHLRRSPEEVKSLLRQTRSEKRERPPPREKVREERPEPERKEARRAEPEAEGPPARGGGGGGPRVSTPAAPGGAGLPYLGWLLLAGLALAVVVVALVLYLSSPRGPRKAKTKVETGPEAAAADDEARQVLEGSPDELSRQAEALAGEGRFREAVRVLYLAMLALLNRRQFIRFEPTRTNGEYVRQVRLSDQAPPELHEPFRRLTELFEAKWYGELACEAEDYRAGRALAGEIQQLVRSS